MIFFPDVHNIFSVCVLILCSVRLGRHLLQNENRLEFFSAVHIFWPYTADLCLCYYARVYYGRVEAFFSLQPSLDTGRPSVNKGQPSQGTLTYRRYTQSESKLKFNVLLKAYDGKYIN